MPTPEQTATLEAQIAQWRESLRRRQAIHAVDVAELEDHLREQVAALTGAGLAPDEAFLVAVKRMGSLDALSREFARENSERLWKQLVVAAPEPAAAGGLKRDTIMAFAFAAIAGALVKLPALLGIPMENANEHIYVRNISFYALPALTGYFAWKRGLARSLVIRLAAVFAAAFVVANVHALPPQGPVETLLSLHLPMALWLAVGIAYAGGRWGQSSARMDFIRFSGELFIYFVLIALGGGVTTALTRAIFKAIDVNLLPIYNQWVIPCCASAAVVVAAWLVEAKQSVVENMAPVLTRIFTPIFALALVTFLGALVWTGRGIGIDRNVLIIFDVLLAVVVALLLYALSARDPEAPPGPFDWIQLVLISSAFVADVVALSAILARISEFGFTPNRVAALGENVILLVNLGWATMLAAKFLRGKGSFASVERWQTGYLPVYAAWAAIVAVVFPLVFRTPG